jgi:peptide/nickel transport system permease protein
LIRFILRRVAFSVLAVLVATMLVFALSRATGDPRLLYAQQGGYGMTPESWEALGKKLRLDKPLIVQYFLWVNDAIHGNLGETLLELKPVARSIAEKWPNTFKLALGAWILATIGGVSLGVMSAVKRGTLWDMAGRIFALFGQALPVFWVGLMAILVFGVYLRWIPTGTMGKGISIRHIIMPTLVLAWLPMAAYLRLVRSAMLEILDSEFIKYARAKGVAEWWVIWKHAFRNALLVPLTFSALQLVAFIQGAVVVETVFSWPGLGRLSVEAVWNSDFPTMVGVTLVFTVIYVTMNLITDIAYGYVDPRIRYD